MALTVSILSTRQVLQTLEIIDWLYFMFSNTRETNISPPVATFNNIIFQWDLRGTALLFKNNTKLENSPVSTGLHFYPQRN
jgi:hypothetical protein